MDSLNRGLFLFGSPFFVYRETKSNTHPVWRGPIQQHGLLLWFSRAFPQDEDSDDPRTEQVSVFGDVGLRAFQPGTFQIGLRVCLIFRLLVLKGIYHDWKHVCFVPGTQGNGGKGYVWTIQQEHI